MSHKLYTSFEDLYSHTVSNSLANWLYDWEYDIDCNEAVYAVSQMIILHPGTKWDVIEPVIFRDDKTMIRDLFESVSKADSSEVPAFLNNLMHIMHLNCSDLRAEATRFYAEKIMPCIGQKAAFETVYLGYSGIVLTGKDEIPEVFKTIISDTVKCFGCEATMKLSWWNSHNNNGDDYRYDIAEDIICEIFADDESAVTRCAEALRNLNLTI